MIAMAGLLLTLSIAGNVFLLYAYNKKPKPRPQVVVYEKLKAEFETHKNNCICKDL